MLIGFPTESEADYQMSKAFLKAHEPYIDRITPGWGCGIQRGSDLEVNQKEYGVYWKDGQWYSENTSPEIRGRRLDDFRKFCHSLDVAVH